MENKVINPQKVYNVEEASKVLDINPQTLLEYLRNGRIVAQKIGEWKILGQSLLDFLSRIKYTDMPLIDSIKAQGDDAIKDFIQNVTELVKKHREASFEKSKPVRHKKLSRKERKALLTEAFNSGLITKEDLADFLKKK